MTTSNASPPSLTMIASDMAPVPGGVLTEALAARVALVDDDDLFRESLGLNLADAGHEVLSFDAGTRLLDFFAEGGAVDLVLLDWRMPRMDGIEVLRALRARSIDVPVIFLTVLSDHIYEEAALAGGALDFVEKSRSLPILMRRMQLILSGNKSSSDDLEGAEAYSLGDLELRLEHSRALWKGGRVELTLTEFNIVKLMAARPDVDVSYREIYDLVHGKGFVAGYGTSGYRANVRAFIKRIRQKFRQVDPGFDRIENYPGFGYRWGMGGAGVSDGDDTN